MTNPEVTAIHQFVDTVSSMEKAWSKAGGIVPTLSVMDGDLTAMDLLVIMSRNGIRFCNIE